MQREASPSFLNRLERRIVRGLVEVFIEDTDGVITVDDVVANIDRYLVRIDTNRTRSLRWTLFVLEYLLPRHRLGRPFWPPWPFRPPLSLMAMPERRDFVWTKLRNPRNSGLLRDLARIQALFVIGYYGDERVHDSIRHRPPERRPQLTLDKRQPAGHPLLTITRPVGTELNCDVCVIGSGAGGAVVAYHAAAAGHDVIVLEEGSHVPSSAMNHREWEMMPAMYKEGGLQATVDLDLNILQGQVLGGSTTVNNAICFRLNDPGITPVDGPDILEQWAALGAHVDRAALDEAIDRVERMLEVRPLLAAQAAGVPDIDGPNARRLLDGWSRLVAERPELGRFRSGLFRKNIRGCLGCGYCNFGCPYDRKLSMVETYLPAAAAHGARIVTDCHVVRILHDGRRATSVVGELDQGGNGAGGGARPRPLTVRARSIVVAGGAIGSSVLLMKSGVRGNVGHRFSFNAGLPVFARFAEPVRGFEGVQMAAYIDGGDYLLESLFYPPMALASVLPNWIDGGMRHYEHLACAGVLVGTEPNAWVKRSSLLRSLFGPVNYKMSRGDMAKMRRGIARLAEVFFAAGAEEVYPATFVDTGLAAGHFAGRPGAILDHLQRRIRKQEDMTLGSAHPQGGNPMSDDPAIGVVDSQFRVHGFENLFVCDASVFPTSVRINPQLTIMAMADYFVHQGQL